ncbi:MAG: carbohydrate-binding domain-containing protein [Thermotaleaceae bacterium]
MNKKSLYFKLMTVVLCVAFLFACVDGSALEEKDESPSMLNESPQSNEDIRAAIGNLVTYKEDDLYSDWKTEKPNYIELNGTTAALKGSGAKIEGSKITITAAGIYVLSGKLDNGQIIVEEGTKGTVRLVLNGVDIYCSDNAPIYVKKAGKAVITLEEGTENNISDGSNYVFADPATDEPNAAVFSKADLTINGTGKLTVYGNYNNGISSKDDLKITGGNIEVYSADDGLMGRDMVAIKDGNITIEAKGDGIKSTNNSDTAKGFIAIEGGTFNINAAADGIQAKTSVLIDSGSFTIHTGGDSENGSNKTGFNGPNPWGNPKNTTIVSSDEEESQSTKGIKSSMDILIGGGSFKIDSADDGIHSNGSITIAGGAMTIASGDDGIHGDTSILITGGKINITKSYEGIESAEITISDGDIHIISSDDGINVASGNDGSAINGRPRQSNLNLSENNKLIIEGGYIVVDANGDGLDANGSIYMSGGTVIVNGPTSGADAALDYDGTFEMSGGFLIATGSSRMAQGPSSQSTQYAIGMNFSQMKQAGTLIHLEDSQGKTIVTFAPKNNYQSVVISSPALKKDTAYTLYTEGTSNGNESDGLFAGGTYQGGSKVIDFTISNAITWLSETGVTAGENQNWGPPNNPGFGGKQNRPERIKQ